MVAVESGTGANFNWGRGRPCLPLAGLEPDLGPGFAPGLSDDLPPLKEAGLEGFAPEPGRPLALPLRAPPRRPLSGLCFMWVKGTSWERVTATNANAAVDGRAEGAKPCRQTRLGNERLPKALRGVAAPRPHRSGVWVWGIRLTVGRHGPLGSTASVAHRRASIAVDRWCRRTWNGTSLRRTPWCRRVAKQCPVPIASIASFWRGCGAQDVPNVPQPTARLVGLSRCDFPKPWHKGRAIA